MLLLLLYLFLALCVSFLCSFLESVLLSTPSAHIEVFKNDLREEAVKDGYTKETRKKMHSALLFLKVKNQEERYLSAIWSLNTIAQTLGSVGVGIQSYRVFGSSYIGVAVAVFTFLMLAVSEVLPKSLGSRYWRASCLPCARIIRVLTWILYPLVLLSQGISCLVNRGRKDPVLSREEVSAMVRIGSREGIFQKEEEQGLRSILQLQDLRVRDIMTPRIVTVTASEDMSLREFYRERSYLKYSRIPVYEAGNPDDITGFVLLKNVFEELAADHFDRKLSELKRPILVAAETQKVLNLWNRMQQPLDSDSPAQECIPSKRKREQIAMVVDEYGSFVGLVTVEDIVETMIGMEIVDEKDTVTDMQEYARKKWHEKKAL